MFETGENDDSNGRKLLDMDGVQVVVESAGTDSYQIVQLLSSNPQDYLNEKYMPGKMIKMQPLLDS